MTVVNFIAGGGETDHDRPRQAVIDGSAIRDRSGREKNLRKDAGSDLPAAASGSLDSVRPVQLLHRSSAPLTIGGMLAFDLLQLGRQLGPSIASGVNARSGEWSGRCLPRLIEEHADQGAADTEGAAGTRIDTAQPDHSEPGAAPVPARDGESRSRPAERRTHSVGSPKLAKPVARRTRPLVLVVLVLLVLVLPFLILLHLDLGDGARVGVGNCCTDTQSQDNPQGGDGDSSVNQGRQELLAG